MSVMGVMTFCAALVAMSSMCITAMSGPFPVRTAAGSFLKKSAHW